MSRLNYTGPSELNDFLHHLPHCKYDTTRLTVDSDLIIHHTKEWAETLSLLAVVPIACLLVYFIIEVLFQCCSKCCRCCRRTPAPQEPLLDAQGNSIQTSTSLKKTSKFAILTTIISIILLIVALKYTQNTEEHIANVCDAVDDAIKYKDELVVQSNSALVVLQTDQNIIDELLNLPAGVQPIPDQFISVLEDIDGQLSNIRVQSIAFQNEADSNGDRVESIVKDVRHYNRIRTDVTYSVLAVFIGANVLLAIAYIWFSQSRCCTISFQLVTGLLLTCSWIITFALFALSVGTSDICQEPDTYTQYIINDRLSGEDRAVANYYFHCVPGTTNPMNHYLADARTELRSANQQIVPFMTYVQSQRPDLYPYATQFVNTSTQLDGILASSQASLDCTRVHNDYILAVNEMCQPTVSDAFTMIVVTFVAVLVMLVSRCCFIPRSRSSPIRTTQTTVFTAQPSYGSNAPYVYSPTDHYMYLGPDGRPLPQQSSTISTV